MGIDVSRLSTSAQEQILRKLREQQQKDQGDVFAGKGYKHSQKTKAHQRVNKYGNKRVVVDGIQFDSRKEADRWVELDAMLNAGEISDLHRQVKFHLVPAQRIDGKIVERSCDYIADFVYEQNGETVVEDVKGYRNPNSAGYAKFVIKRKLMLWVHGIRIREV